MKGIFPGPWEVGRVWSWWHSLTLGNLEMSGSHLIFPSLLSQETILLPTSLRKSI